MQVRLMLLLRRIAGLQRIEQSESRYPVNAHTKGPWTFTECGSIDADGFEIALVHGTQRDANAQLIAACPDLLEACEEAYRMAENHRKATGDAIITAICHTLRAAIKKASGGK